MRLEEIAQGLGGRRTGHGWQCRCPAHDDNSPSLLLYDAGGSIGLKCYAGCSYDSVVAALAKRNLWPEKGYVTGAKPAKPKIKEAWDYSVGIEGTGAETYLKSRGITLLPPPGIRFTKDAYRDSDEVFDALTSFVMGEDGTLLAYQHTYLTKEGLSAKGKLTPHRRTFGNPKDGAVVLPGRGPLVIAEGVETALSIWQATGLHVMATLTLTNNPKLGDVDEVVIAGEADDDRGQAHQALIKRIRVYQKRGLRVRVAQPHAYEDKPGTDLNDVLMREGEAAVRQVMDQATSLGGQGEDDGSKGPNQHDQILEGLGEGTTGSQWLIDLNAKYAVAKESGKTWVIEEELDEHRQRTLLNYMSFTDFTHFYMNRTILSVGSDGIPKVQTVGEYWLKHPNRRQYEAVRFSPDVDVGPGVYNLWRGWRVEAKPGSWDLMKRHIFDNICGKNREYYRYVVGWMATAVQHPGVQGEVALVLQGKRGTGKTFFVKQFGYLFGQHYLMVSNSKHVTGNFNEHLRDVVLLFADEAFWAGDKASENVLKTLVTGDTLNVEPKGRKMITVPNRLHIVMASNNEWVVPAGMDERRFAVFKVGEEQAQKEGYFKAIEDQLKDGGYEAWLHDMQTLDLSDFSVRTVPQTEGLVEQKLHSLPAFEGWWFSKLRNGDLDLESDDWNFGDWVPSEKLYGDYISSLQRVGQHFKMTDAQFWIKMNKIMAKTLNPSRRWATFGSGQYAVKKKANGYAIPDLLECRQLFEEAMKQVVDWPEEIDGEQARTDDLPF